MLSEEKAKEKEKAFGELIRSIRRVEEWLEGTYIGATLTHDVIPWGKGLFEAIKEEDEKHYIRCAKNLEEGLEDIVRELNVLMKACQELIYEINHFLYELY